MKFVEPLPPRFAEGQMKAAGGQLEDAVGSFATAIESGRAMGLRPLLVRSHIAAAAALRADGKDDEAGAEEDAARRAIDDIAATFSDGELRANLSGHGRLHLIPQTSDALCDPTNGTVSLRHTTRCGCRRCSGIFPALRHWRFLSIRTDSCWTSPSTPKRVAIASSVWCQISSSFRSKISLKAMS